MAFIPKKEYKGFTFYYTTYIEEELKELGYTDKDINSLAIQLVSYANSTPPKLKGDVIKNTGGAVKLRIAPKGSTKGVQGEDRMIYCFLNNNQFFFLAIYGKSDKANLTMAEIKEIKKTVDILKKQFKGE